MPLTVGKVYTPLPVAPFVAPLAITSTITVVNTDPLPGVIQITDIIPLFPVGTTRVFSSVANLGATGNTAAGIGTINDNLNLPSGASVVYTIIDTINNSGLYQNSVDINGGIFTITPFGGPFNVTAASAPGQVDVSCEPACAPNPARGLPVRADPVPCCDSGGPSGPVTATGVDCDGNPVVVTGVGVVQTVPDPNSVQLVRLCDVSGEVDTLILCDPVTGDRVIVVVSYTPAGLPITDAYNLDGTPYLGVISALIACSGPALDSEPLEWCFAGANVTQWIITEDGEPTGVSFWTDAAGAIIPAPAPGPTLVRGVCAIVNTNQWRASGVLAGLVVFNLAAAVGLVDVVGFTVSFIGDFGTIDGIVTPPGSWTWSAEDGQEITNLPTAITSNSQFFVHWTERT